MTMHKPYQVQTMQMIETAPGYGAGWVVVSEWQWHREAREAANGIAARSHDLAIRIVDADTDHFWNVRMD
jgi:hypothetical protein